ncbi:uncharacterized protein LOC131019969 [Salvia miltiorrhiza]|uniref:uncharacterized protein LOC131019969 n=1 Tax=Salvia miltiorrhiza TaxID=226208 RepID=UPI0025AD5561|nr:uncharacterized protein LOC131019969 [Salvia miltiorrhiza]
MMDYTITTKGWCMTMLDLVIIKILQIWSSRPRIDAEVRRLAAATGREHRLDEVYLDVVQPDRSRIYGIGSAGQSQASRGSIRSTCTSAVSQQLYETRISTLEKRLAAEQAERQAMQEHMAQMEQFMRMYSGQRAPSPDADDDDDDAYDSP